MLIALMSFRQHPGPCCCCKLGRPACCACPGGPAPRLVRADACCAAGFLGFYNGLETKIVQSILAAALMMAIKEKVCTLCTVCSHAAAVRTSPAPKPGIMGRTMPSTDVDTRPGAAAVRGYQQAPQRQLGGQDNP